MRQSAPPCDHIADPKAKRFAIGADAKGVLRYERNHIEGDHVVLLVSELVGNDYLAHLRRPACRISSVAATLRVISHRKLPGGVNWFRYRVL